MTQSIDFKNPYSGKKMAVKGTFERNGLPSVNKSHQGPDFAKIKTYRPYDYQNNTHRAGGDNYSDVSSQVRRDALGQRVRDRFNEDISKEDFKQRPASRGNLKLNSKILSCCESQSNTSKSVHHRSKSQYGLSGKTVGVTVSEASKLFKRVVGQPEAPVEPMVEAPAEEAQQEAEPEL